MIDSDIKLKYLKIKQKFNCLYFLPYLIKMNKSSLNSDSYLPIDDIICNLT